MTPKSGVTTDAASPDAVWARLRAEREARGLSLGDVSASLKLTPKQIAALERGDLESLPGIAFARGFTRNYARFLDLDPAGFLAAIDAGSSESRPRTVERMPTADGLGRMPSGQSSHFPALPAALVSVALLIVLVAGWYFQWFEPREERELLAAASAAQAALPLEAASVPLFEPQAAASQPETPAMTEPGVAISAVVSAAPDQSLPVATPQPAAPGGQPQPATSTSSPLALAAQPGQTGLAFAFEGDSWVEVRDGEGKLIFKRLNQAGSSQDVQGAAPLSVVVGNATRVKLNWKGAPVDLRPHIRDGVARLSLQ